MADVTERDREAHGKADALLSGLKVGRNRTDHRRRPTSRGRGLQVIPQQTPSGVWLPIEQRPPALPGYLLVRQRPLPPDGVTFGSPQNVPIVVAWNAYTADDTYQFAEHYIFERYTPWRFAPFTEFMWLP